MKALHMLLTGFVLLLLTIAVPVLILKFGSDPQNPDLSELEACCVPIPLAILSLLFSAVGITRFINERADKGRASIRLTE